MYISSRQLVTVDTKNKIPLQSDSLPNTHKRTIAFSFSCLASCTFVTSSTVGDLPLCHGTNSLALVGRCTARAAQATPRDLECLRAKDCSPARHAVTSARLVQLAAVRALGVSSVNLQTICRPLVMLSTCSLARILSAWMLVVRGSCPGGLGGGGCTWAPALMLAILLASDPANNAISTSRWYAQCQRS